MAVAFEPDARGCTPAVVGHGSSCEEAIDDVEWREGDVLGVGSSSASRSSLHAELGLGVQDRLQAVAQRRGGERPAESRRVLEQVVAH